MNDFRLAGVDTATVPLKVVSAISPQFHNNPAFEIFSYDRTIAASRDVAAYDPQLADPQHRWTSEYRFTSAFGVPAFDRQGVATAIAAIKTGGAALKAYLTHYASAAAPRFTAMSAAPYVGAQSNSRNRATKLAFAGHDGVREVPWPRSASLSTRLISHGVEAKTADIIKLAFSSFYDYGNCLCSTAVVVITTTIDIFPRYSLDVQLAIVDSSRNPRF